MGCHKVQRLFLTIIVGIILCCPLVLDAAEGISGDFGGPNQTVQMTVVRGKIVSAENVDISNSGADILSEDNLWTGINKFMNETFFGDHVNVRSTSLPVECGSALVSQFVGNDTAGRFRVDSSSGSWISCRVTFSHPYSIPPVCHAFLIEGAFESNMVEQMPTTTSYMDIIPREAVVNTVNLIYGYQCIGVDNS